MRKDKANWAMIDVDANEEIKMFKELQLLFQTLKKTVAFERERDLTRFIKLVEWSDRRNRQFELLLDSLIEETGEERRDGRKSEGHGFGTN
jgi:hypothetical protein